MIVTMPTSKHAGASLAGFSIRTAALLIDLAIVLPVCVVIVLILAMMDPSGLNSHWDRLAVLLMIAFWLAYTSLEIFKAATPGKMILKLRITYPDGENAEFWTLFLRGPPNIFR